MRFDLSTLHVEEYCNAQDRALGFKWGREKGKMELVPSVFRIPGFWSSNREGQGDAQDNKQACMAGINGNSQILVTISKSIEQFFWRNVMINSFFLSKSSFLKN